MASVSESLPRVIALIDLPDLRWQMNRIGRAFEDDLTVVVRQLESGLAKLGPGRSKARLPIGAPYAYSAREADQPREADRTPDGERVMFRGRGIGVKRECQACGKACTHCQGGASDPVARGRDNPIGDDLIELAREDAYDWAVVVSGDLGLISVVRFVQSHGRKIIHGCFPPVAMDLTRECWASVDLSVVARGVE